MEPQPTYRVWQVILGAFIVSWGIAGISAFLQRNSAFASHPNADPELVHTVSDILWWGIVVGPSLLVLGLLLILTAKRKIRLSPPVR